MEKYLGYLLIKGDTLFVRYNDKETKHQKKWRIICTIKTIEHRDGFYGVEAWDNIYYKCNIYQDGKHVVIEQFKNEQELYVSKQL